ncbi:MAG TPA: DUF898 family protein [Propylenella sp.]|nr:DUF898 family protein [Propylenella sp.]
MNVVPAIGRAKGSVHTRFTGAEGELFGVLVRGSLLQIPTFGFYRFWLITDVRRHLWTNTRIGDDSFEYIGRGKELLIGFLIALAVLVPVYLGYFLLALEAERLQAFASVPMLLTPYVLGHYAVFRARRYRATRTIFRGLRFWMTGSGWAYTGRAIWWDLVTVLTLGFAYPWRSAALERYKLGHTRYGNIAGAFVGRGLTLFRRGGWLWALFLASAALAGVLLASGQWVSGIVLAVAVSLASPFLLPVFRAMELRWWLEGVRFGPVEMASDLAIGAVTWCYAKTVLAWLAYGIAAAVLLGLVAAVAGGLFAGLQGLDVSRLEALSLPAAVLGGIVGVVVYVAFLLGLDIIRRLFLDRGIWAVAAHSVTLRNIEAVDSVAGTDAREAGSVGEGLLDALDMGGF